MDCSEARRVGTGQSNHAHEEDKKQHLLVKGFFLNASRYYPIDTIYYPACGDDNILVDALPTATVYYVDRDLSERSTRHGVFWHGDFMDHFFLPDSTFDAVFLKDIHLTESNVDKQEKVKKVLEPLKPGALVVAARFDACGIWERDIPFLQKSGFVAPVNLTYTPAEIAVFRKR